MTTRPLPSHFVLMARNHFDGRRDHANVCGHERANENARGHVNGCARECPRHVYARLRRRRVDVECQESQESYRHRLQPTVQNISDFDGLSGGTFCQEFTASFDFPTWPDLRSKFNGNFTTGSSSRT